MLLWHGCEQGCVLQLYPAFAPASWKKEERGERQFERQMHVLKGTLNTLHDWCISPIVKALIRWHAVNFKPSMTLSQTVGVKPSQSVLAEHFLLLSVFSVSVSTGLPTHSSYLSVPAEAGPHLAFCIYPHISHLVCLIFDEVEMTGRNLKVAGWEKMTKRLSVPFYEIPCALFISYICSTHSCILILNFFFWICDLLKLQIPSAVTNFMGEQILCPGCWEGREQKGKSACWLLYFNWASRQQ